jgi:nucleotide-binding universal stress UspA family protein
VTLPPAALPKEIAMPSTIVVPLDGSADSERALRPAAEVAARSGAHVVVMTARYGGVVTEPRHYLRAAADAAGIDGAEPVVVDDRLAASAVASVVETVPDPVVCLASHARGGLGEAVFGSVAEETLRLAGTPTLLVGPEAHEDRPLEELVMCVDGSSVGAAIAPVVSAWAVTMRLPVIVLGVAGERTHGGSAGDDVSLPALRRVVDQLAEQGVRAECRLLRAGAPADAIVAFAATREQAFLAMATHGRTGIARVTAGSVTMGTVRSAPCPVLTVRPAALVGDVTGSWATLVER